MDNNVSAQNHLPPSTRDVLGGHLHQKVTDILRENFIDGKIGVDSHCSIADKITGILLERSLKDIHAMLQDDKFLLENLRLVFNVLHEEFPQVPGTLPTDNFKNRQELSHDEIGEMVFERVFSTEESKAAQITGMLLELDNHVLLELVNSDGPLFETAVQKAKEVLSSVGPPTSDTNRNDMGIWKQEGIHVADKESLGHELYAKIQKVHPECVGNLTGMILELDLPAVKVLLMDKQRLQAAIARAYTEWTKHS